MAGGIKGFRPFPKVINLKMNDIAWLKFKLTSRWQYNMHIFNAKYILVEEQLWYYLIHSNGDKGIQAFPKGISPKVNIIV